jgi:hypothetical protein
MIAANDKEFERHIHWCVKNQDEARAIAREARELVLRERTFATEIDRWRDALASVPELQEAA